MQNIEAIAQIKDGNLGWEKHVGQSIKDTAAVNRYMSLALKIAYDYPDSARVLAQSIYEASRQSTYELGMAQSLVLLGKLDENNGDFERAVQMYRASIPHLLKADKEVRIAVPFINIANAYFFKGAYDEALKTYYEALAAGKLYQRPLSAADSIRIYLNIALAWDAMGGKKQAVEALRAAEKIPGMFSDSIDLADYYSYAAHIYTEDQAEQAVAYCRKAFQVGRSQQSNTAMLPALNSIASIYTELKQADSAIAYLRQSKTILDSYPNAFNYHRFHYRHQLGRVYLLQGKYTLAAEILTSLDSVIHRLGLMDLAIDLEKDLSILYEETGKYDLALKHARNYAGLKDTLLAAKSDRAVALWSQLQEAKGKADYIDGQLKISQQQIQLQQKNMLLAVIVIVSVLMIAVLVLILKSYRRRQLQHADAIIALQQKMEIDSLKAKIQGEEKERGRLAIELHDNIGGLLSAAIYNLESDRHSYPDSSYNTLEGIIRRVSREIRRTSHNLMPDILMGQNLSVAVSQYCAFIEQETGLDITLQERGTFQMMNMDVQLQLYRIIQELLQNILKHAEASCALLQLHADADIFSLTVEDDGKGLQYGNTMEGKGIKSIKERLRTAGGNISFCSEDGKGTSVYIELPINYSPE